MTSSASKSKAPSVLTQSLIASGVILLLGIWHTISGKSNPPDNDESTGMKDDGEHQDSTVNDKNSDPRGKNEKSEVDKNEENESKTQPRGRKAWLYEFTHLFSLPF